MNEGPKVFVARLLKLVSSDLTIYNPSISDFRKFIKNKHKKNIILRLDGVTYYRFNNISFSNYLIKTGYNKNIARLVLWIFPRKDYTLLNYIFNFYINRISYSYLRSGQKIVFQSRTSLEMHHFLFYKLNWEKIRYRIIYNGVDVDRFAGTLPTELKGGPKVIISASTYRINKRLFEAIVLINYLKDFYPNIHLHVLGNLDNLVKDQIEGLNLNDVTFHGLIHVNDLPSFYSACDIQLSLSIFDPCPNVVIEGLACGLPVITPLQSGASELVGENVSWIVDEGISFGFYNLHDKYNFIPFRKESYASVFMGVYEDLAENKIRAKHRANELDIKEISSQYLSFLSDV